jgi:hypothetical protein
MCHDRGLCERGAARSQHDVDAAAIALDVLAAQVAVVLELVEDARRAGRRSPISARSSVGERRQSGSEVRSMPSMESSA